MSTATQTAPAATRRSPKKKRHLIIIDGQNDFCDPKGSLFVPGADDDMKVKAPRMIKRVAKALDDIHITLDCHSEFHVAHALAWWDYINNRHPLTISDGHPPTLIPAEMVRSGEFGPPPPLKRALGARWQAYVDSLKKNGRYDLCIWPPHCLIGTWGNNYVPELMNALRAWERDNYAIVDKVTKGSNPYTEHYSALMADVPDPKDPGTQLNTALIRALADPEIDEIGLMGEALYHCWLNTLKDLVDNFGDDNIKKLTMITDCCSKVSGVPQEFDDKAKAQLDSILGRGMKTSTSTEWLS